MPARPKTERRSISDLHVNCSLDTRTGFERLRGGFAASDTCQCPANSAVRARTGAWLWRCPEHEGILELGEVRYDDPRSQP